MSNRNRNKGRKPPAPTPKQPAGDEIRTFQHHLFVVAISPVQPFIAAARRMRDLAFGSQLLSELAGALAQSLQRDHGARMIFPAPAADADAGAASAARSTNKIVCLLPPKAQPPLVAAAMRACLAESLDRLASECLAALGSDRVGVDEDTFRLQLRHALQSFAAWSKVLSEDTGAYASAYQQVQALLDARKGLRNLLPPPARAGQQLSSLDGARDSVLADGHPPTGHRVAGVRAEALQAVGRLRKRFQIDPGEQLDAIGLAKRVLGTERAFPALVRVALQPWVAQWQLDEASRPGTLAGQRLGALTAQLELLRQGGLGRRNSVPAGHPAAVLPFDGDLLLQPRRRLALQQAVRDQATDTQARLRAVDALLADEPALRSDEALAVAVLVADGDHMGSKILSEVALARPPGEMHRQVARALAGFADEAGQLVRQHGGCDLYAGGDDLLAALPVQTVLDCAEALRHAYVQRLCAVLDPGLHGSATLSIGVAIGHVSQPMGRLLQQARDACQAAKDGPDGHGLRDALCLAVQPRAGAQVRMVRRWQADPGAPGTGLVPWLQRWVQAFADGTVSGSLPYDLHGLTRDEPSSALVPATVRLFERRGVTRDDLQQDIVDHWARAHAANLPVDLAAGRLADALYVCRWLAAHPRPASPPETSAPAVPGQPGAGEES